MSKVNESWSSAQLQHERSNVSFQVQFQVISEKRRESIVIVSFMRQRLRRKQWRHNHKLSQRSVLAAGREGATRLGLDQRPL